VTVAIPQQFVDVTADFIAELEKLQVESDIAAKVVVNERTGTVVMGHNVKIMPVSIVHGNLAVEIQTVYQVSQPEAFSQGTTQVVPQTTIAAKEEKARNILLPDGAKVEDLVRSLAAIGATPRDVVAILQALQRAGALQADLEII
jgi:flagellar P-ring protein precursor FlgI